MLGFNIETALENVKNKKTQTYLQEVIDCYNRGNFRSSVVMLYSVVITDLIYKLKDLDELYEDETAKQILEKIESKRKSNPTSSEWENILIEDIHKRMELLELKDYLSIKHLKDHRNLCAHPSIESNYELFTPNKEIVRSHLRNIMEGIFLKDALLSKNIFKHMTEDLARIKDTLLADDELGNVKGLEKYLKIKYFDKFNKKVEESIFRSLWKITYISLDQKCEENRMVNHYTLKLLVKSNPSKFLDLVKSELTFYSNIPPTDQEKEKLEDDDISVRFYMLSDFFEDNISFYVALDTVTKDIITLEFKKNFCLYFKSPYINESLEKHIEDVIEKISDEKLCYSDFMNLLKFAEQDFKEGLVFDLVVEYYGESCSFDEADRRYVKSILPFLERFNEEHFTKLIEKINSNSQIRGRGNARETNTKIKEFADKVFSEHSIEFDYSKYPFFKIEENEA